MITLKEYEVRLFGGKKIYVWAKTREEARHKVFVKTNGAVQRLIKSTGKEKAINDDGSKA